MATWDELFKDKNNVWEFPQTEVMKFVNRLESSFIQRPLAIWDLCCGAGRNSVAIANRGHSVFSSDVSPTVIRNLRSWLKSRGLSCETQICEMNVNPWNKQGFFNGVFCWDALHHNTIDNIKTTVELIHKSLISDGLFMTSLISTKSGLQDRGKEIEPNTFVNDKGAECGVPHHYFDETEIRNLFKKWKFLILAEIEVVYIETENEFYKNNPFPYTKWNLLVTKES